MAEWKNKSAEQLAEDLIGTCGMFPDEFEDAPMSFLEEFDSKAFRCETCNWWHEADEAIETDTLDQICPNCAGAP